MRTGGLGIYSERLFKMPSFNEIDRLSNEGF